MAKETTIARESKVNPINAVKGSPFGEAFDSGNAYMARMDARNALNAATTPRLYGRTDINLGSQGTASVNRTGTERRGSMQMTLNGKSIGSVDYNEDARGFFKKSADEAFKEVKRRIGYYVNS